jgi:hypothetical protein
MPARLTYPTPLAYLPLETMAAIVAASGLDVADDAICIQILVGSGFAHHQFLPSLELIQDRARTLRCEWAPALPEAA